MPATGLHILWRRKRLCWAQHWPEPSSPMQPPEPVQAQIRWSSFSSPNLPKRHTITTSHKRRAQRVHAASKHAGDGPVLKPHPYCRIEAGPCLHIAISTVHICLGTGLYVPHVFACIPPPLRRVCTFHPEGCHRRSLRLRMNCTQQHTCFCIVSIARPARAVAAVQIAAGATHSNYRLQPRLRMRIRPR